MKLIRCFLFQIFLLTFFSGSIHSQSMLFDDSLFTRELMKSAIGKKFDLTKLIEDNGTILRSKATHFMRDLYSISDSFDIYYEFMTVSDTIGIAHDKSVGQGKMICVKNFSSEGESYLILDLSNEGEIRNVELFAHSNDGCCWQSIRDGFEKIGDFFAFKNCSRGSRSCGASLFLFSELDVQDRILSIPYEGSMYVENDKYHLISVRMELLNENRIMLRYQKQEMILKGKKKLNVKFQTLKETAVEYLFENGIFTLVSGEPITLID